MKFVRVTALTLSLITTSALVAAPQAAQAQAFLGISVRIAPPPLPVYEQPPLPGPDYLWTPGYWAWDDSYGDYYWVPGAWVQAPEPGYLWTPSYWGWDDGLYVYHGGYWGQHIGYYGGVDYGFGYTGDGFEGGYWSGRHYFYNQSVNNFGNAHITNIYNKPVAVNRSSHVSYNGGPGGVTAQPTQQQMAAQHEHHVQATPAQTRQVQAAHSDRSLFASSNHGAPPVAATQRAGQFKGPGVVKANNAPTVTAVKLAPGEARAARVQGGAHPAAAVNAAHPANEAAAREHAQTQPATHGPSGMEAKLAERRPMTSEARPAIEARPAPEARPAAEPRPSSDLAVHPAATHTPMTEDRRTPVEPQERAAPRPTEPRAETPRPSEAHMAAPRPMEARPAEPHPAAVHAAPAPHPAAPRPPAPHPAPPPHPHEEPHNEHDHGR